MRICYVLLSTTFGMHQYTADLADRMARAGNEVCLVTTRHYPADRYSTQVAIQTPCDVVGTGLTSALRRLPDLELTIQAVRRQRPDVVHVTGPHVWNVPLVQALTREGIPVLHTIHDLDPHSGKSYGMALHLWNRLIIRDATHILVHGQAYRDRLLSDGLSPKKVSYTPLLHLFLSSAHLAGLEFACEPIEYSPWALFFGRLEEYKGLTCLLAACDMMNGVERQHPAIVVAGPGDLSRLWAGPLPRRLELRSRLIADKEAFDLFRRCGLVVLPYLDATQSALIAAAYYFRKPVVVTRTGALPEYVEEGRTGCVVEPDHPAGLARCLEGLLADPKRLASMGNAGRDWYDAARTTESATLLALYERLGSLKRSSFMATLPQPVTTVGGSRERS